MKELSLAYLSDLAATNPGNFAIYQLKEGRLGLLFRSENLPAFSGLSADEYDAMMKDDPASIVLAIDRPLVQERLQKGLIEGRSIDLTYRIFHRVYGSAWVHGQGRFIGTYQASPVLYVIFADTESESAETNSLVSDTVSVVYVIDKKTHELLFVNPNAARSFTHHDWKLCRCFQAIDGLDSPCPWCPILQMKNGFFHDPNWYSPLRRIWYDLTAKDMNWRGRDAVAFYCYDITKDKELMQSLEFDKKSLETILNNVPIGVGVFRFSEDKLVGVSINSELQHLLHLREEDFSNIDSLILTRVHPEDCKSVQEAVTAIAFLENHVESRFRFQNDPKSPDYRWFDVETNSIQMPGGRTAFVCVSDITAEKETEADVLHSRQVYEAAVEAAHLAAWEFDILHHRIVMANNTFVAADFVQPGLPEFSQNAPQSLLPFIAPESRAAFLAMYEEIESGAPKASCEVRYVMAPGAEPRFGRISYTTVFDSEGKPVRAYGIGENISKEKMEEERYEKAFGDLEEAHPYSLGSCRFNLNQKRCLEFHEVKPSGIAFNSAMSMDEYFAAFATRIANEETRRRFLEITSCDNLLARFHEGETRMAMEFPFLCPDGIVRWREGLMFLIQNPKNLEIEGVTYDIDIDQRKKNERIIDHLTSKKFDYIAILYLPDKTIEFCNKQDSVGFGETHERLPYESWRDYLIAHFIRPEDEASYRLGTDLATIAQELSIKEEYTFAYDQDENGGLSRRQIQYRWLSKAQQEVILFRSDITAAYEQEKRQLEDLTDALRRAEEANDAKSEFVSRISHDIRTPISIIQNMISFALEDMNEPKKLQDDLGKIQSSSTFLLSLISDVLDISKIDSGKIELHLEPYSFVDCVSTISNMFIPLCAQNHLAFVVPEKPHEPAIMADHIRLNQIALNLLSNAVKYTPEGGTITFIFESHRLPDGKIACLIEVIDTGIGMSEEFQKKMFEPFTQEYSNPNRPKATSGTGLGLAIVKRIIDLLHGTISVKSALGKGTDVALRFIADSVLPAKGGTLTDATSPLADALLKGKVLLCEDNEINMEIAQRLLLSLGLKADWAANGKEAVARFSASLPGEYCAILMDIQMPLMNGYEATAAIRALARPDAKLIPIIAMTADVFTAAMEHSKKVGMTGYVTKPLDANMLRDALLESEKK